MEIDYRPMWDTLLDGIPVIPQPEESQDDAQTLIAGGDYQEGEIMLHTFWSQGDPYNLFCPAPPPGSTCTWPRCAVGCNATAGAQVLRHWAWPPYGVGEPFDNVYNWWNMPSQVYTNSPLAEIIAVAELSYEVGYAGNSTYCVVDCATSCHIEHLRPEYVAHFRYNSGCWIPYRENYSWSAWFNILVAQLNKNRTMTYGITGHAIVCDGWQVLSNPPLYISQYHMNWGHGNSASTTWYTVDSMPGDTMVEHVLSEFYPVQSIGSTVVSGTYSRLAFPYRYFDRDATASFSTTFSAGQNLQFLPEIRLKSDGYVKFDSSTSYNTRIFADGDSSTGIRLMGGKLVLQSGSALKMH
jgi:hypothetical protein